jgi:hypothetical protein
MSLEEQKLSVMVSIAQSLQSISNELIRLNDKLDKLTFHDALSIVDLQKL